MPVKYITEQIQYPEWAGERYKRLDKYQRFLDGTIYDHLKNAFHQERESGTNAYIPLRERRPSVIYNLCRMIVNRSTRLLFGDKRFPKFQSSDPEVTEFLNSLADTSHLQAAMLEAAYVGSIGSVAVFFAIREGKVYYEIRNPRHCTPKFDSNKELESVRIMYPILGFDARACGFEIKEEDLNEDFFFIKDHTTTEEVIYNPIRCSEYQIDISLTRNEKFSTSHNLSFVPGVWIKNLWPTDGLDGECTFSQILHFAVEIDYQLSQCGRGLKYNSDPQLLIKEPSGGEDENPSVVRSSASAIYVGEDGDAKLLEISGQGQKAVLEFVGQLRQYALEVASGSRKDPQTSYGNMSGRAMEILEGDLISLASAKRLTYGEAGLKPLMKKILKAAKIVKLFSKDPTDDPDFTLELYWGNWFDPTPTDYFQTEQALDLAVNGQRLYMHEARMLSATTWNVGNANDPKKLEERWPIPPVPPMEERAMELQRQKANSKPKAAPGNDGRDAKVV